MNYLQLANTVLRRFNEVELTAGTFASAIGIQAMVLDALNTVIADIHQMEYQWPFTHDTTTVSTVVGQNVYALNPNETTVDWKSFYVAANTVLNEQPRNLQYLDYHEWLSTYRPQDDSSATPGAPQYVVRMPDGQSFAISPFPDQVYQISYDFYDNVTLLASATDVPLVPAQYHQIIVDGATYYVYLFNKEADMAQIIFKKYEDGIAQMRAIMINRYDYVRDGRMSSGGSGAGAYA